MDKHSAGHRKPGPGWAQLEYSLDQSEANNTLNTHFLQVWVRKGECGHPTASRALGPLTCTAS